MMTGKPPYTGNSIGELLLKHTRDDVPRLPSRFAPYQELTERLLANRRTNDFRVQQKCCVTWRAASAKRRRHEGIRGRPVAPLVRRSDRTASRRVQNTWLNSQYNEPEITIAAGSVSTQAVSRLRIVDICRPDLLAAMVPATPDEST